MPSTLLNFADTSRKLRPKLEVDLTRSGSYTDYTDYLDNFTIYSSSSDKICGIYDTVLDAEINLPTPSIDWVKQGRPVRSSIAISNDSWATNHSEQLFIGSTSRQNSVPVNNVKIKATTLNSDFLSKKVARQLFTDADISTIIESLLLEVGVNPANIDLDPTGVILPSYPISSNQPIRYYIEDLAKPTLSLMGFDKDNVFRAKSLAKNSMGGSDPTPEVTINLNTIESFDSRDMSSKFYNNKIKVKGYELRSVIDEQIYFNNQLQGYELKGGSKLYFTLEIPQFIPTEILPFQNRSRPVSGGGFPIGRGSFYGTNSFYDFYLNDDGSGEPYSGFDISVISQSIANNDGKEVLFAVFQNSSSTSYFLKSIVLNGSGSQIVSELIDEVESVNMQDDGGEILFELDSMALQNDVIINQLIANIQLNFWVYSDVYKLTIRGRPDIQVGTVLGFQDYQESDLVGVVFEVDTEVSIDKGFIQTLIVKSLLPNPESGYLAFDVTDASFGVSPFL